MLDAIAAPALGILIGSVLGLAPALHANTSAVVAAALVADPLAILGAAGAHTVIAMLPTTFLGAPPEDAALAAMPAHRLLAQGHGRLAHRVALAASLAGLTFGVALVLPFKWAFAAPLHLASPVSAAAPVIVAVVALLLVAREPTWPKRILAALLWLGSGLLALAAFRVPLVALVPVPATAFAPLLSGLFAGAGLIAAMAGQRRLDEQQPMAPLRRRQRRGLRGGIARGLVASVAATVVPGLTPGTAAVAARIGGRDNDVREIAMVAAINTGQTVLTVAWLFLAQESRTGITALLAQDRLALWTRGAPPVALAQGVLVLVAAGLAGAAAAMALERVGLRLAATDARVVSAAALAAVTVAVLLLSGWLGLVIYGAALCLGLLAHAWGVGRLHLAGALSLPFLVRSLGA